MAKRPENVVHRTLRIGELTLEIQEVGVGYARAEMSNLMRDSAASGRAFLIRNARNTTAPSVLLMSPEVLSELLSKSDRRRTQDAGRDCQFAAFSRDPCATLACRFAKQNKTKA